MKRFALVWIECWNEWTILLQGIGCNGLVILVTLSSMALLAPGYLIILPLVVFFIPNAQWSPAKGRIGVIAVHTVGILAILSSLIFVKSFEMRYHTNILCEICGRPGHKVEYTAPTSSTTFRVFCDKHDAVAPKEIETSSSVEAQTPGFGILPTKFASGVLWLVTWSFVRGVGRDDPLKFVALLSPVALIILGISVFAYKGWIDTLLHP